MYAIYRSNSTDNYQHEIETQRGSYKQCKHSLNIIGKFNKITAVNGDSVIINDNARNCRIMFVIRELKGQ
jgi:hypothetical protein